jgi:glyoxylase-like metal-dependent hydrolase (beta-lactamase superfamily II)
MRPTGRGHTKGDQVIEVPDAGLLFTGDLVETGQFAIFPWFPPHDADVSGLGWIAVMEHLISGRPKVVVPGHGDVGGPQILEDTHRYLLELRDETWKRRDSQMSEATIAEEVEAVLIHNHPQWAGQMWIGRGVACLCTEGGGTGPGDR